MKTRTLRLIVHKSGRTHYAHFRIPELQPTEGRLGKIVFTQDQNLKGNFERVLKSLRRKGIAEARRLGITKVVNLDTDGVVNLR